MCGTGGGAYRRWTALSVFSAPDRQAVTGKCPNEKGMSRMSSVAHRTGYKLPQVTALFWVLKIAATTLGETGGDEVAQTLHLGYLVSFFVFIAIFLVAVTAQLRAKKLHPPLYWTVIIATSTAGTTLSDFLDRTAGLGYLKGSLLIFSGLGITFLIWSRTGETFAVEKIRTLRGEGL